MNQPIELSLEQEFSLRTFAGNGFQLQLLLAVDDVSHDWYKFCLLWNGKRFRLRVGALSLYLYINVSRYKLLIYHGKGYDLNIKFHVMV